MPEFLWCPVAEYSSTFWKWNRYDYMKTCVLAGEKAWTNGSIVCLGEPPYPTEETISLASIEPFFSREVHELHPVAVADLYAKDQPALIFDSRHMIRADYFNLFREKWPAARFFGDEAARYQRAGEHVPPLLVRIPITKNITNPSEMSAAALDSGAFIEQVESFKLVGLIMCLRSDHDQEKISEVLEAAKGSVHA